VIAAADSVLFQVSDGKLPNKLSWEIDRNLRHFKSLVLADLMTADFKMSVDFKVAPEYQTLPMTVTKKVKPGSSAYEEEKENVREKKRSK